jgi:hypothetical protein
MEEKEFTNEYVKYQFTKDEIDEIAAELAQRTSELETAEDEKKAIMSDLKGRIDSLTATVRQAATKINNGYEMRNVKCEIVKDFKSGQIKHVRTDTGDIVRTKKMTDNDRQMEI